MKISPCAQFERFHCIWLHLAYADALESGFSSRISTVSA